MVSYKITYLEIKIEGTAKFNGEMVPRILEDRGEQTIYCANGMGVLASFFRMAMYS